MHLISPDAKKSIFEFDDGEEYDLSLGTLDPSDEVSGLQKRLTNVGYYEGPINGLLDDAMKGALANYQSGNRLDATGRIDDATQALLKAATGA